LKKRNPIVAGYFYPDKPEELRSVIEWSFKHRIGPGKPPSPSDTSAMNSIGYVAPHAGYIYSGPVAAHVYFDMALNKKPDTIVILGTNHTGLGRPVSVYPEGVWGTPLGDLVVDDEVGRLIVENSEIAEFDEYAHLEEHSIEVQLPFIVYTYGGDVKITPIVIGIHTPDIARDLAKSIHKASMATGKRIIVIASSDFNHYEPHEETSRKDSMAIDRILKLDTDGLYNVILRNDISICGPGGIMTLMEYTKILGGKAQLLKYATSGDTSGDYSHVVGYAALKFYI
jgi:AmmeMemoRadiSam system protein B